MKKFLAILVLGLLICNVAVTKSSLPECEGNDPLIKIYTNDHYTMMRKWTNCHGTTIGPDGQQKYVGEFFMGNFHEKVILHKCHILLKNMMIFMKKARNSLPGRMKISVF